MNDKERSRFNREKKKKKIFSKLIHSDKPQVTVFRSNTCIYCSLINVKDNRKLASTSSREIEEDCKNCNTEKAYRTGELLGEKIKALNIKEVIFNRNGYLYHGKIKSLADGIRSKGIVF